MARLSRELFAGWIRSSACEWSLVRCTAERLPPGEILCTAHPGMTGEEISALAALLIRTSKKQAQFVGLEPATRGLQVRPDWT